MLDFDDYRKFTALLEAAGYAAAAGLVECELVPLSQRLSISLYEAAWRYANQDEEQDTAPFQLFLALQSIPDEHVRSLAIHDIPPEGKNG